MHFKKPQFAPDFGSKLCIHAPRSRFDFSEIWFDGGAPCLPSYEDAIANLTTFYQVRVFIGFSIAFVLIFHIDSPGQASRGIPRS